MRVLYYDARGTSSPTITVVAVAAGIPPRGSGVVARVWIMGEDDVDEKKARQAAAAQRFAERLNRLFHERRRPDGEEYTLAQVEEETDGELSVAYLSMLRNGGVAHPRIDKLTRIADFFGVDIRYFTALDPDAPGGEAPPELSAKLRKALENPWTRDFAAKAGDMGPEDYQALMNFWEYTSPLRRRRRRDEHGDHDDADRAGESSDDG